MRRYYCFGYGVPSFLILSSNILTHSSKLYSKFQLELDCFVHGESYRSYFLANSTIFFFLPYQYTYSFVFIFFSNSDDCHFHDSTDCCDSTFKLVLFHRCPKAIMERTTVGPTKWKFSTKKTEI